MGDLDVVEVLSQPEEIALAKHLLQLDEVINDVADKLYPNKLCDYLYDLAQKFNAFYEQCPVVKAEQEEVQFSRAALCAVTSGSLDASTL